MAEHSTADREVPGSTPGAPSFVEITIFAISTITMELLYTTVAFRDGLNTFLILCNNVKGVYFKTFTFDSNAKEFLINESLAYLRWCYLIFKE